MDALASARRGGFAEPPLPGATESAELDAPTSSSSLDMLSGKLLQSMEANIGVFRQKQDDQQTNPYQAASHPSAAPYQSVQPTPWGSAEGPQHAPRTAKRRPETIPPVGDAVFDDPTTVFGDREYKLAQDALSNALVGEPAEVDVDDIDFDDEEEDVEVLGSDMFEMVDDVTAQGAAPKSVHSMAPRPDTSAPHHDGFQNHSPAEPETVGQVAHRNIKPAPPSRPKDPSRQTRQEAIASVAARRYSETRPPMALPDHPVESQPPAQHVKLPSKKAVRSKVLFITLPVAAVLVVAILVFGVYPAWVYSDEVSRLEDTRENILKSLRPDTYTAYVKAEEDLAELAGVTSDPWALQLATTLGFRGVEQERRLAKVERARILALLAANFGDDADKANAVLKELGDDTTAQQIAARAYLQLAKSNRSGALESAARGEKAFGKTPEFWLIRGIAYTGDRRYKEAEEAFDNAISLDGELVAARAGLGAVHVATRNPKATVTLRAVLNRSPDHSRALVQRAQALLAVRRDLNEAKEHLDKVRVDLKDNVPPREMADAHAAFAAYHAHFRQTDEALKALNEALKIRPDHPPYLAAQVEILLSAGELEGAEKVFESLDTNAMHEEDTAILRAHLLVRRHHPNRAVRELMRLKTRRPKAKWLLARIYISQRRWEDAKKALADVDATWPMGAAMDKVLVDAVLGSEEDQKRLQDKIAEDGEALGHYRLGLLAEAVGKPEDAIQAFSSSAKLDTTGKDWFYEPPVGHICLLLTDDHNLKEASKMCEQSLKICPEFLPANWALMRLKLDRGLAVEVLERINALEDHQDHSTVAELRARVATMLLDQSGVDQSFEFLLKNEAPQSQIDLLRGIWEFRMFRYDQARVLLERVLKTQPNNLEATVYLALTLGRLKEPKKASKLLTREVLRSPRWKGLAHAAQASAYRQQNNWKKALRAASRAARYTRKAPSWEHAEAQTEVGLAHALRYGLKHRSTSAALNKAVAIKSNHARAAMHSARSAAASKDVDQYRSRLKTAVERNPNYCPAVKLLRREKDLGDFKLPETCQE